MRKVLNYRPIVFFCVTLMPGIALSFLLKNNYIVFGILCGISFAAAVFFIFRKKTLPLLLIAGFLCGFLGLFIQNKIHIRDFDGEYASIETTVYKVYTVGDKHLIYGKDVVIDGKKINGNIKFFTEKAESNKLYNRLEMNGELFTSDAYSDINGYGSGVYYTAKNVTVKRSFLSNGFIDRIRYKMTSPMDLFMDNGNKGVALSLVFGDTVSMDASENTAARIAGVYHIYSVSGLHISFLIAVVSFVLSALKVKNKYKLFFVLPFIILYIALSNFPPSAIRAAIMSAVYLFSHLVKRKTDPLSTLAFTCASMLIFSPILLFSYSFLMSVSAIAGIVMFYKPIKKVVTLNPKSKINSYFASAIALSISSNILLVPLTLVLFGQLSTYFIIANIIIVPLATFTFLLVIIVGIICLIAPNLGSLYALCNFPLLALRRLTGLVTLLPQAYVNIELGIIAAAGIILIAILWSRYFLLKKSTKQLITAVIALLTISGSLLQALVA